LKKRGHVEQIWAAEKEALSRLFGSHEVVPGPLMGSDAGEKVIPSIFNIFF
jgi:hypothetical protein